MQRREGELDGVRAVVGCGVEVVEEEVAPRRGRGKGCHGLVVG